MPIKPSIKLFIYNALAQAYLPLQKTFQLQLARPGQLTPPKTFPTKTHPARPFNHSKKMSNYKSPTQAYYSPLTTTTRLPMPITPSRKLSNYNLPTQA